MTPLCVIAGDVIVGDSETDLRSPIPDPDSIALARPKSSTFTVPSVRGTPPDVGRLQVAANDALLVRRFQGPGDLPGNRECLVERGIAPPGNALRQILAPSTSSITSAVTSGVSFSRP